MEQNGHRSLDKSTNFVLSGCQNWQIDCLSTPNSMYRKACFGHHMILQECDGTINLTRECLRGNYHCTVDLLFDWFGISCMTTDNFCFYLQNRLIQTSQTGGQQDSDTSPFSIPDLTITALAKLSHSSVSVWNT
jgi:hypothetical protein